MSHVGDKVVKSPTSKIVASIFSFLPTTIKNIDAAPSPSKPQLPYATMGLSSKLKSKNNLYNINISTIPDVAILIFSVTASTRLIPSSFRRLKSALVT